MALRPPKASELVRAVRGRCCGRGVGFAGDQVEGEGGVGGKGVEGLRGAAVVQGEGGDEGFDGRGGAKGVAGEALGAGDRDPGCIGAEREVESGGFSGVVGLGGGAVGVDVVEVFGVKVGVGQAGAHGLGGAMGAGLRDVVGVGGHAEAEDFGVVFGVAGLCGFQGFEGEDGGPFGEDHAVARGGKGLAGGGGDDAHAVPGAQEAAGEGALVGAGEGGGDEAAADHLEGEADGVGA